MPESSVVVRKVYDFVLWLLPKTERFVLDGASRGAA